MALSDDIRDKAWELLSFELELPEFEDWLASETWNVHLDPDAVAAGPLAYGIELLLSEYSGGHRTENEFRASLGRLLQDQWAEFSVVGDEPRGLFLFGAGTERAKVPA